MKGWRALTSTWERPIRPVPPEVKPGRQRLLSDEDRKTLYLLDKRAAAIAEEWAKQERAVMEEIAALFDRVGLAKDQRSHQVRSARREYGAKSAGASTP